MNTTSYVDIINMDIVNKKKIKISSNIVKKLSKKTYSLHYLPQCLVDISKLQTIEYKGNKIKSAYLIDIVNSLLLKYYFKKENKFTLNSLVLKDRYGYLYKLYIDFLVERNIIHMVVNYKKGVTSRIYALNPKIIKSKIFRYKNADKVLLKKYKKKIMEVVNNSESSYYLINDDVREKLISDLFSVQIDIQRSVFYLDSVKDNDYDIYNRNLYAVESINDKHIFFHFDSYGRMHTNFTILRSFIRKNCLLIDGEETCEIDISNSQPLFLSKLIYDLKTNWVKDDEFEIFKQLTVSGRYYQYLMQKLNIKEKKIVKEMTYKVLFGRNAANSKSDKLFKSIFPTIHKFITLYKREKGDYKILAYDLQKMESNLIFNKIIKKIINHDPSVKLITIHDSIVMTQKNRLLVESIFKNELHDEFNF
jgi:hypothetical protein